MLIELILYGSISGISSFFFSFYTTRAIIKNNILLHNLENNHALTSKVNFDDNVTVLLVPSVRYLSENNIKELWYNADDYNEFKIEYSTIINEVI